MTASTSTSTIAPIDDDQRRLDQRGDPREPPLGFALELLCGTLEHRRERAALLAVGDQVNENRRKRPLFLQRARKRHALAHELRRGARGTRERDHAHDVGRRVERAQQRCAAADENRERARVARGVEARGEAADAGHPQQRRVDARPRTLSLRSAACNAIAATIAPRATATPVARKNPLIAISACVSNGSVCRLCW